MAKINRCSFINNLGTLCMASNKYTSMSIDHWQHQVNWYFLLTLYLHLILPYPTNTAKSSLPVQTLKLHQPSLQELRKVIKKGLNTTFAKFSVDVVDCPNLQNEPFGLAATGLGGRPRLIDVGGLENMIPTPNKSKIYNLDELSRLAKLPGAFVIGGGSGPFNEVGTLCEFMANARTKQAGISGINASYIAKVDEKTGQCDLFQLPENNECSLMLTALLSKGRRGKVLKVNASHRIGPDNFPNSIRNILNEKYGPNPVGMGGVFLIKSGKARFHITPDFSAKPLLTEAEVMNWLRFYDMRAPLVCLSTFLSFHEQLKVKLDPRPEHTHCFSDHNEGGHYYADVTPEEVEYVGYFVPAPILYRIDKPTFSLT